MEQTQRETVGPDIDIKLDSWMSWKVDLHHRCGQKQGIIEVKGFVSAYQLKLDRETAAQYAKSLGLGEVIMAVFIPVEDEAVLATLSGQRVIKGVQVRVVATSWV